MNPPSGPSSTKARLAALDQKSPRYVTELVDLLLDLLA